MEGRRVNRQAKQRNPLYVLFLCLIAAVFVLLIVAIVLGVRLSNAQKALSKAEAQIEALRDASSTGKQDPQQNTSTNTNTQTPSTNTQTPENNTQTPNTNTQTPENNTPAAWLDLSKVTGVDVKPSALLDKYYTYYTTENLNVRKGPGTNYDRVLSVEKGESVQVAAKQGNWMFARIGDKFGWMSADYLSTIKPAATTTTTTTTGRETTSGNLRRN